MPRPKKGPRFGGSPSHHRLMLANLAAHLFASEAIVTTEAKAKVLRPYAERLITKAKKGGVHQQRQVVSRIQDKDVVQQALHRDRSALRGPQRRLHAHPQARPPRRRRRAHGAHRARLAPLEPRSRESVRHVRTGPSKVRLVVAYDGTGFRGFAPQHGAAADVRTVGGVLGTAIEKVLRHPVELVCAGRTDAGVHARGQVVSFEAEPGLDPWRLQTALNSMLGPEIVVRSADLVEPDFDARRSATARTYVYTIVNRADRRSVPRPLRVVGLRTARPRGCCGSRADVFVGEHDFASFCRKGPKGSTTMRRVLESRWHDDGDGVLRFEIRATRVLLADGALDRRHAGRGRQRQAPARRPAGGAARRRPRRGRATRAAARPLPLGRRVLTGRARTARSRRRPKKTASRTPLPRADDASRPTTCEFEAWYRAHYRRIFASLYLVSGDRALVRRRGRRGVRARVRAVVARARDGSRPRAGRGSLRGTRCGRRAVPHGGERRRWRGSRRRSVAGAGLELAVEVWDAVGRLPSREREVIALRYLARPARARHRRRTADLGGHGRARVARRSRIVSPSRSATTTSWRIDRERSRDVAARRCSTSAPDRAPLAAVRDARCACPSPAARARRPSRS